VCVLRSCLDAYLPKYLYSLGRIAFPDVMPWKHVDVGVEAGAWRENEGAEEVGVWMSCVCVPARLGYGALR
jgi:hypothetical protein